MDNVRPEVKKFMQSCEHLFGFTNASGGLTADECQVLEYYADELRRQMSPVCGNSNTHCHDSVVSS